MPLVAHNNLPTFERVRQLGIKVLESSDAIHQDIRELHVGLLNMMPDSALAATERQFFRLVGESNPIAQFYIHPFTLDSLTREPEARQYINKYYENFDQIKQQGLDALIITGAHPDLLTNENLLNSLIEIFDWAEEKVTSTLCSCLATHAVLDFRYQQKRRPLARKKWGVFPHQVVDKNHPLVCDINSRFDVPHSRWNAIFPQQFEAAGLRVLVTGDDGCIHLATSPDGLKTVYFQGHPEYDTVSLLKELKREVTAFLDGDVSEFPPFPEYYLSAFEKAVLNEYRYNLFLARQNSTEIPNFPEQLISASLHNTWHDTAGEVVSNWMGLIYQTTHKNRHKPVMEGIDRADPLGLLGLS